MIEPKYPDILVNLKAGQNGPIPTVRLNLCWNGVSKAEQREFVEEATKATDRVGMLNVMRKWVTLYHEPP